MFIKLSDKHNNNNSKSRNQIDDCFLCPVNHDSYSMASRNPALKQTTYLYSCEFLQIYNVSLPHESIIHSNICVISLTLLLILWLFKKRYLKHRSIMQCLEAYVMLCQAEMMTQTTDSFVGKFNKHVTNNSLINGHSR